jgi:hypothetical protein
MRTFSLSLSLSLFLLVVFVADSVLSHTAERHMGTWTSPPKMVRRIPYAPPVFWSLLLPCLFFCVCVSDGCVCLSVCVSVSVCLVSDV